MLPARPHARSTTAQSTQPWITPHGEEDTRGGPPDCAPRSPATTDLRSRAPLRQRNEASRGGPPKCMSRSRDMSMRHGARSQVAPRLEMRHARRPRNTERRGHETCLSGTAPAAEHRPASQRGRARRPRHTERPDRETCLCGIELAGGGRLGRGTWPIRDTSSEKRRGRDTRNRSSRAARPLALGTGTRPPTGLVALSVAHRHTDHGCPCVPVGPVAVLCVWRSNGWRYAAGRVPGRR